jgi:ergothioneine biosynthesis protein EgtB
MSRSASLTPAAEAADLARRFATIRALSDALCETLNPEDSCIQSMPSASPTRWHLAHTSWFFETFLLKSDPAYRVFDEHYEVLFNSYYNTVGEQFPRDRRGLLSRPTLAEVFDYRRHVDRAMNEWFASGRIDADPALTNVVEWGVQHEQQHQELILTDVKHLFSVNPLLPAFRPAAPINDRPSLPTGLSPARWLDFAGGVEAIGHAGEGFAYDNESPQHRVFLDPFRLASRPVTSGEFIEFMDDGGYRRPELWLSAGWSTVVAERWSSPLYWHNTGGEWSEFTLAGLRPLNKSAPVAHVSYFEADAYARWAAARLPTEAEWEVAARAAPHSGNFVDMLLAADLAIHPSAEGTSAANRDVPTQMFGDVWEWTASPYVAYPGYQPPAGALGEYNGKFMCNQYVLRGGSCATPSTHIRATYRNFFPPEARWQFTGIRLAK